MPIVPKPSNMILLSPPHQVEEQIENRYRTGEVATPGHFAEMYDDGGTLKWRKASSATESQTLAIYLENGLMNKGIHDDYVADELARVAFLQVGNIVSALLPSGQNITYGEKLSIGAGGTVITAADTTAGGNVARLQSLDNPGAVTALTRIRVQVIN